VEGACVGVGWSQRIRNKATPPSDTLPPSLHPPVVMTRSHGVGRYRCGGREVGGRWMCIRYGVGAEGGAACAVL
jgi:hypothetical protein